MQAPARRGPPCAGQRRAWRHTTGGAAVALRPVRAPAHRHGGDVACSGRALGQTGPSGLRGRPVEGRRLCLFGVYASKTRTRDKNPILLGWYFLLETTRAQGLDANETESPALPGFLMALYGYARVSTLNQNLGIQRAALNAAGCDVIRAEKASGTRRDGRTELQALLDFLGQAMHWSSRASVGSRGHCGTCRTSSMN